MTLLTAAPAATSAIFAVSGAAVPRTSPTPADPASEDRRRNHQQISAVDEPKEDQREEYKPGRRSRPRGRSSLAGRSLARRGGPELKVQQRGAAETEDIDSARRKTKRATESAERELNTVCFAGTMCQSESKADHQAAKPPLCQIIGTNQGG